jgi:hypothetical protein
MTKSMKKTMTFRVTNEDVVTPDGEILTEADFERMSDEAARTEPDYEAIEARARSKGGRPSLRDGISPVLQVRIDDNLRQQLNERAEQDHTTPSRIVRDAIQAFLAS